MSFGISEIKKNVENANNCIKNGASCECCKISIHGLTNAYTQFWRSYTLAPYLGFDNLIYTGKTSIHRKRYRRNKYAHVNAPPMITGHSSHFWNKIATRICEVVLDFIITEGSICPDCWVVTGHYICQLTGIWDKILAGVDVPNIGGEDTRFCKLTSSRIKPKWKQTLPTSRVSWSLPVPFTYFFTMINMEVWALTHISAARKLIDFLSV